jgi:SulP family sulfate permease
MLEWMRTYDRAFLRGDVVAGLAAGAVVIPQAMAYGTVAGLPVQAGLYTCIVPMIVYALLGGARRLSMSTTSTIVALTGLALVAAGSRGSPQDLLADATTLTFLVGATLVVARVLRLGFLVECVSEAVLIGLKVGVGLTIAASQLPKLLGIPGPADSGFFHDIGNAVTHLHDASGRTVLISIGTIATLVLIKRFAPKVPGALVAVVGGIVLVAIFNLDDKGVAVIPRVPRGLPTPHVPPFDHISVLLPYAIAIALMAYLESVSVARSTREPTDPPLDNNQEFIAVGGASLLGSFFQSVPAAGGFSQTLVNADAGAQTQLSELVTAALAIFTALVFAPVLSDLPQATLGAIVLVVVSGLISFKDLRLLARLDTVELVIAIVTGVVALVTNLLVGVAVGVLLTFYLILRALNHPVVVELQRPATGGELEPVRDGDIEIPGLLALRIEGGLYTANIRAVQAHIFEEVRRRDPKPDVVLVDVGGTADTSVTVMDVFLETDRALDQQGIKLWIANIPTRANEKVLRTKMQKIWLEEGKLYPTVAAALTAYERNT